MFINTRVSSIRKEYKYAKYNVGKCHGYHLIAYFASSRANHATHTGLELIIRIRLVPGRVRAGFELLNPPRSGAGSYLRLGKPNSL